jgi:hypothetical protein
VEINGAWEIIRENIKMSAKESLGYFELKKRKSWFDEGCPKLVDQRKRAKLHWLQHLKMNRDNVNNIRREDISGIKERNVLKTKLTSFQ